MRSLRDRRFTGREVAPRFARLGLVRHALAAAVGVVLVAGVSAADPDVAVERIAVLDAGTFLVLEVREAPLGEVLERMASRLRITFTNTERVDLSRVVDGRRLGSAFEVMRWLVPEHSFVLLYETRTAGDARPPRLEQIGF